MKKKISLWLFLSIFILSCSAGCMAAPKGRLGILASDEQRAAVRAEDILSAVQNRDSQALKDLFSPKAQSEASALDQEASDLMAFLEGEVVSWESDNFYSEEAIEYGKRKKLLLTEIFVYTDRDEYCLFVYDYNPDTIDPDNEGIYMIEVSKLSYNGTWESWEDRMRAGIDIIE